MKTGRVLRAAGLYCGVIGAVAFVAFILIFGEDWTHRYRYLNYLMPLPVISLLVAKKLPLPGGLSLMATGIGAAIFDILFSPGYPGQVAGRGLGYTLFFVALPLVTSGVSYLMLWWKFR